MNIILLGILGYISLQLLLGVFISRKIHTEDAFLFAGRKLGYALATFSIFAAWFGAESCVGTPGAVYADGLAGVTADPLRLCNMPVSDGSDFRYPALENETNDHC